MAKSNRRRKLDRAKRQARDSQKQAASRRQREWRLEIEAAASRIKRLANPGSPLAETAGLLHTTYGGGPVNTFAVSRMQEFGWSTERLTELADAMFASGEVGEVGEGEPSLTALTFAAQVARAAGDQTRASDLLDQALASTEAADDSRARLRLTDHLRWIGRLPEAIEMLEASLRDDPDDKYATEHYGIAIGDAYEQGRRTSARARLHVRERRRLGGVLRAARARSPQPVHRSVRPDRAGGRRERLPFWI